MIDLDQNTVIELPVDQLGLAILKDFYESGGWNENNYVLEAQQHGRYEGEALTAIAEALAWVRARGLTATDPKQSSPNAIFVTRIGRKVLENGPESFYATERLQQGLHPKIEAKARPQFLIGEYEQGVFAAMKAVEVRVRKLSGLGKEIVGVDLMNKAFGQTGPLTDKSLVKGEREGIRSLFAGAYAVFRNPAGHHEVEYDDVVEAAEAVQTASLLMRILDRVEGRQTAPGR
jgi:uncharacterized protein (TIGR02391 family)